MPLFVGASESYDTDAWEAYNLKKENAKLRQQLADVAESMGRVEERCAKLRELLGVMAYCNQFRRDCDGCSMNGAAGIITERAGCDALLDRLRELGIEVMQ